MLEELLTPLSAVRGVEPRSALRASRASVEGTEKINTHLGFVLVQQGDGGRGFI